MREPFIATRAVAARPERALDRVWLGRVQHLAVRDVEARGDYVPPWAGTRVDDAAIEAAIADGRAAETEAEMWAASAAWGRAVEAQADNIAAAIRAENEGQRPTVAALRAVLVRGTDADLARLAAQTGGVPVGGRAELVAGLAMRAATIAERCV